MASIPIITFGAATTATLLTAEISLRKDGGKILKTFFKQFKKEFKQATILWIIQLPILAILAVNMWMLGDSQLFGFLKIVICIAFLIIICWIQLWFAYLSKFEDYLIDEHNDMKLIRTDKTTAQSLSTELHFDLYTTWYLKVRAL